MKKEAATQRNSTTRPAIGSLRPAATLENARRMAHTPWSICLTSRKVGNSTRAAGVGYPEQSCGAVTLVHGPCGFQEQRASECNKETVAAESKHCSVSSPSPSGEGAQTHPQTFNGADAVIGFTFWSMEIGGGHGNNEQSCMLLRRNTQVRTLSQFFTEHSD